MKNLCSAMAITLLLSSCITTKTYTVEEKKMKLDNDNVLVIESDGTRITGNKLKISPRSPSIKIDDQEIKIINVQAYQSKSSYFVKYVNDDKIIWSKQLKRGKINLYYFKTFTHIHNAYYDGTKWVNENKYDTHFLFSQKEAALEELSIAEIAQLLKNNKAAYKKFTATFGEKSRAILSKQLQNHPKILFEAIDIFNGDL